MNRLGIEPGIARHDFAQAIHHKFRFHFARNDPVRAPAEQFERQLFIRLRA